MRNLMFFLLLLLSTLPKNDANSKQAPDCQNITCFGAADCKLLKNHPKCVPVIQKISLDDVIMLNLNITDDVFGVNTNQTSNFTDSSGFLSPSFPIILTVQMYLIV